MAYENFGIYQMDYSNVMMEVETDLEIGKLKQENENISDHEL